MSDATDAVREKDGLLDARAAGDFIRNKMAQKGIQIQQLADKVGIRNPSQLSNLLAGRSNIGRSHHFRAIATELGLSTDEIEYLNPNIIFVHPETRKVPRPIIKVDSKKPLPEALKAAIKTVSRIPGYEDLDDAMARRLLPQGLDGKGPQTEGQWVEFLLAMKHYLG